MRSKIKKVLIQIAQMFRNIFCKKSGRCLGVCLILTFVWVISESFLGTSDVKKGQETLDYIADNIKVSVKSLGAGNVAIKLQNTGGQKVPFGYWRIYFFSVIPIPQQETENGMKLSKENGGLHFISPIKDSFKGLNPMKTFIVEFDNFLRVAKSDYFPNWYVASIYNDSSPRVIKNTAGPEVDFVEPFTIETQWKRSLADQYDPYTPKQRYKLYETLNKDVISKIEANHRIIPTPVFIKTSEKDIQIDHTWTVISDLRFYSVARFLSEHLGIPRRLKHNNNLQRDPHVIEFLIDERLDIEEYAINTNIDHEVITITARSENGAFYGINSFLSNLSPNNLIPEMTVRDKPRFPYRGLMLDVARNFISKEDVMKVIDIMSMYKLNILHLHLTDDEGWRIEIPSIPELTKVGAKRCHERGKQENKCLSPSLGSGPFSDNSGSGYYSVSDYREVLRYAADRFVKVIPEIDVPGHSRASIVAMEMRENIIAKRLKTGDFADSSYLLTEKGPPVEVESVQGWKNNAVNPCLNSTYMFIDAVIEGLINIYGGVQTLDLIHIGGDEVPPGVWLASPSCQRLLRGKPPDDRTLKKMFMIAVADIAAKRGLDIATWEDGIYSAEEGPFKRNLFKNADVFVNAWNNIWLQGRGGNAIEFANNNFQTVLSMGTHLYFDHPYEPDPEERGLYWATRFTDTKKVFSFIPDDIFANAEHDHNGHPINLETLCQQTKCPILKKPENIVGMEACLWTETIRTRKHLFYMLFPRLIAMAERAWHKSEWENNSDREWRAVERNVDWQLFLNTLARKELPKLERKGIHYRIPPPGVNIDTSKELISVNTLYPGHKVEMSLDNVTWTRIPDHIPFPRGHDQAYFRTISKYHSAYSRTMAIELRTFVSSSAGIAFNGIIVFMVLISILHYLLGLMSSPFTVA